LLKDTTSRTAIAGETPGVPAERREPGHGGTGDVSLDLITLETSDQRYGTLVDMRTGHTIVLPPPWKRRVRYMARRLSSWADVWMTEIAAGRATGVRFGMTLRPGVVYEPRMISEFVKGARRELGDGYLDHFFVAEMQTRGAVHWNVCVIMRPGYRMAMPDKSGLWPHGTTNTRAVKNKSDIMYMARYWSKAEQKGGPGGPAFPTGLRMFGHGQGKHMPTQARMWFRLSMLPQWLREIVLASDRWTMPVRTVRHDARVPSKAGGLVTLRGTQRGWWHNGQFYVSPWAWFTAGRVPAWATA
jgi:hypothetical protein